MQHVNGSLTMHLWINPVKSVSQHTHRAQAVPHSCSVGMNVYSIGQSADNHRIRAESLEFFHEILTELLTVFRSPACTHHRHHVKPVEIHFAFEEKCHRGIFTLPQSGRISLIFQREAADGVLFHKLQLLLRPAECFRVIECFHDTLTGIRNQLLQMLTVFKNECRTACFVYQAFGIDAPYTLALRQGNGIKSFVVVHCYEFLTGL